MCTIHLMSKVVSRPINAARISRFSWLMALYAENHQRLHRLFVPERLELRLSYTMLDPVTGEPDPSAYLRLYRDARQVEATHCYIGRRWQDAIGMYPPPAEVLDHRLRMNTFLGKWLQYLAERGHGLGSSELQRIDSHTQPALLVRD